MPLDFNEIRQLLVTIAQTDITEVTLKSEDFELNVRKALNVSNQMFSGQAELGLVGGSVAPPTSLPAPLVVSPTASGTPAGSGSAPFVSETTPPKLEQKLVEVLSLMVGTFYRAPAPGEPSFVEVGDRIRSGQTVCIIEAMKLMNEIEAEVSGQVMEILVQNGEPVEYGQPLMRINPD